MRESRARVVFVLFRSVVVPSILNTSIINIVIMRPFQSDQHSVLCDVPAVPIFTEIKQDDKRLKEEIQAVSDNDIQVYSTGKICMEK